MIIDLTYREMERGVEREIRRMETEGFVVEGRRKTASPASSFSQQKDRLQPSLDRSSEIEEKNGDWICVRNF